MRFLAVHPGPLMYTKIYLRLEPLGLELVAAAVRDAGHDVALLDLQVESHADYFRWIEQWRPDVIAFSCNYLANVPEIIDLSKNAKARLPRVFTVVGGHSASFTASEILEHGAGAVDCVLRGEGEAAMPPLMAALAEGRDAVAQVPGAVTAVAVAPPPTFLPDLDVVRAARDLLRHRRKYFIGALDPCASIEFARGCPWDCAFCSAWTFYGRTYRTRSPEHIVEELGAIKEPGIFVVDDVAFVQSRQGFAIGEAIARRGIRKEYYLETRGDVLLRNKDVFKFWKELGLHYMFLGIEAIDDDGLDKYRKRISLGQNYEALEFARSLGIRVAINIIADCEWDRERFRIVREWCLEAPEVVNISVNTPYPGTETWRTEARALTTRDYRLFDIQHAVLPTTLPLPVFYEELVKTQQVLNKKHLGWRTFGKAAGKVAETLARGQSNFVKMLWKFNSVYRPELLLADHRQPVSYQISLPPTPAEEVDRRTLYVHEPKGRKGRSLDDATERFVDATRTGVGG